MELTFSTYSEEAEKTAIYPNRGNNLIYPVLGLSGKAGEIAEKVKKIIRDNGGERTEEIEEAIIKEVGDCLWYLNAICDELGASLALAAWTNLAKLRDRQERDQLRGSGDNR